MFNLEGYTPQKMKDGFEPFKGTFTCGVNYARIEDYSGDKEELKGSRFFRYELEVVSDNEFSGRRLWGSYNLDNEKSVKKLADALFTIGLEFKNEEELALVADKFVTLILTVKAWYFPSKDDPKEKVQMHLIKGEAKEKIEPETAPF